MGFEIDEETKAKMESEEGEDSEGMQEMKAWEQELLHSGDDTFGITLQALPGDRGQQDPTGLAGLAALMGGGFNMGISGQHYAQQGPGLVGAISFEPSMAYATAGLTDGNREGVKFLWEPGGPGYVNVTLTKPDDGPVVYGTVDAELHAEHTYREGRPKIRVNATFAALQGFQSCMR